MNVSHPDRVIFPGVGLTKGDVVGHYDQVGAAMVRFLGGRPLTLERFPKGIDGKGFMQKNAGKHFPSSIERFSVPKRDGSSTTYPIVHAPGDLAYLANQGTVTFHMWTAAAGHAVLVAGCGAPRAGRAARVAGHAATKAVLVADLPHRSFRDSSVRFQ